MSVLVSGFSRFDKYDFNPTEIIADNLSHQKSKLINTVVLPVEFENSFEVLKNAIIQCDPKYIILLGLNSKIASINVEKIAVNFINSNLSDNRGVCPIDEKINDVADLAYCASIDPWLVINTLKSLKIESALSYSAGTFVCNYLYFRVLSEININSIFLHIPYLLPGDNKLEEIINAINVLALKLCEVK